jgi:putative aldouronate transport system substrate-binding protein
VRIPDSGYNISFDWPFGDAITLGYRPAGEAPTFLEKHATALENGVPSRLLGFRFDREPVVAQLAQLQAVSDEFIPQLNTGAGDPAEVLPRFLEQRNNSGLADVIVEITRQLVEWQTTQ